LQRTSGSRVIFSPCSLHTPIAAVRQLTNPDSTSWLLTAQLPLGSWQPVLVGVTDYYKARRNHSDHVFWLYHTNRRLLSINWARQKFLEEQG